ncbi:hypothetical protein ACSLV1_19655 [Pseudomonas aeruginosa]|uniref:hypothetical protein n=1 Tax=Pseudomonas aeruginosa TaxID=287 RepID=UPI002023031C|nr:hypothetical protein [Pseudomonas aeruginosa]
MLFGQVGEFVLHHLVAVLQALMGLFELGVLLQQLAVLSTRCAGLALCLRKASKLLPLLIAQSSEFLLCEVELTLQLFSMGLFRSRSGRLLAQVGFLLLTLLLQLLQLELVMLQGAHGLSATHDLPKHCQGHHADSQQSDAHYCPGHSDTVHCASPFPWRLQRQLE